MDGEVRTDFIGANSLLYALSHRPWNPPDSPWAMTQTWHDVAFLHYAVDPSVLRRLVPDVLTLDLYDGKAFLSILPFWMNHVRPAGVPPMPWFSKFSELNLRTYVTFGGKPGVLYFSRDSSGLSAVWAARVFYRLPFWHANMKVSVKPKTSLVQYSSRRIHGPKAENGMPEMRCAYSPAGEVFHARPRSLEHFLAERYCLYSYNRGRLYRAEVHHLQWPLQPATVEIEKNTMAEPLGIKLPEQPDLCHFAKSSKILIWGPERVG